MFEVVKQAKIGVGEFAKLVGVSRVTASLWLNEHTKPHMLHSAKVANILTALELAVQTEQLPLSRTVAKGDRLATLKQVVQAHSE